VTADGAVESLAVDAWLDAARTALAEQAGLPPAALELDEATAGTLLELARIAAHDSGARTNAPLVCFLAGRAVERGGDLDELVAAVRGAD
jgi:hypothetical protein